MITSFEIGQAVRDARKTMGLRQPELAAAAGVGLRFLVELERGKATIQLDRLLAVLQALGLDLRLVKRGRTFDKPSQ
ncbi:MAG TPA: helix-turn-helix transcriptional regulator [Sphingomicrobium sp.]|nr:helix-turn-helix transcriptional regulator [Sphingomicrobium sp.]